MNSNPPTVANHIVKAVLSHVRNNKDPLIATPFGEASQHRGRSTKHSAGEPPSFDFGEVDRSILHVGIDWGATKTTIKAAFAGSDELAIDETIPTVLGYAKDGLVDGALPDNATTFFGREALTHRRHLQLAYPTIDSAASADFARHLRARLQVMPGAEIRAVIAVPANFDGPARENIRTAFAEHLQSIILLPAPYLAALGYESNAHSIFVDIGATKTTVSLFHGYYPTAEEQRTLDFGGNDIDALLRAAILEEFPDAELSPITIRLLKEKHATVGIAAKPIQVDIILSGTPTTVDLTDQIITACNQLLHRTADAIKELLVQTAFGSDNSELSILLTGGCSRIKNLAPELQGLLEADGYASARVTTLINERSKASAGVIASGALKAARAARDEHWQQVVR